MQKASGRTRLTLTSTTVLLAALVLGCSSPQAPGGAAPPAAGSQQPAAGARADTAPKSEPAPAAQTLKIGVMAPITGPAAAYGVPARNGAQMAFDEINAAGGIEVAGKKYKLEMVFVDDEGSPTAAATGIQRLIDAHGIKLVVGPLTSPASLAAAPIAEQNSVIITSMAAHMDLITDKTRFVLRNNANSYLRAAATVPAAKDVVGAKSVAVLIQNDASGLSDAQYFTDMARKVGLTIAGQEKFDVGTVEFSTIIAKLRRTNTEHVYLAATPEPAALFVKQAKEAGWNITPIDSGLATTGDAWFKIAGPHVKGAYSTRTPDPNWTKEKAAAFARKYKERFNAMPIETSGVYYDTVHIFAGAMQKAGTVTDTVAIRQQILANAWPGTEYSSFRYTGRGEMLPERSLVQFEADGTMKFLAVGKFEADGVTVRWEKAK